MTKPRRCAIYARVSTDEQDESLQLTTLQEFVSRRGWELKATYIDHGVSSRAVRPELERMMRDVADHVKTYSFELVPTHSFRNFLQRRGDIWSNGSVQWFSTWQKAHYGVEEGA
jgi:hypothetical protein